MVTEAIQVVVDAISGLLAGMSTSVVSTFDTLILTTEGKLTTFAVYTFLFIGIGFCTWLLRKLTRKA